MSQWLFPGNATTKSILEEDADLKPVKAQTTANTIEILCES